MNNSQIPRKPITQPTSDQGAVVVNCFEFPQLQKVRHNLSKGTSKYNTIGHGDCAHLVSQADLVFTEEADQVTRGRVGPPLVWSSFNDRNDDERVTFVGIANSSSKNHDPTRKMSRSVLPVGIKGSYTIPNNSTENLFPGDKIMWTAPPTVISEGKVVPLLRDPAGPHGKFTAGLKRLGTDDLYLLSHRNMIGEQPHHDIMDGDVTFTERMERVLAGCAILAQGMSRFAFLGGVNSEVDKYKPATIVVTNLEAEKGLIAELGAPKVATVIARAVKEYNDMTEDKYQLLWGEPKSVVVERAETVLAKSAEIGGRIQAWVAKAGVTAGYGLFFEFYNSLVLLETERVRSRFYHVVMSRIVGKATSSSAPGGPVDLVL